jgi:hypothetical protein
MAAVFVLSFSSVAAEKKQIETKSQSGGVKACKRMCANEYGDCLTVPNPTKKYIATVCEPRQNACLKKCTP